MASTSKSLAGFQLDAEPVTEKPDARYAILPGQNDYSVPREQEWPVNRLVAWSVGTAAILVGHQSQQVVDLCLSFLERHLPIRASQHHEAAHLALVMLPVFLFTFAALYQIQRSRAAVPILILTLGSVMLGQTWTGDVPNAVLYISPWAFNAGSMVDILFSVGA